MSLRTIGRSGCDMSLITLGARAFLDRELSRTANLSSVTDDQLRALLAMAVAEGQSQVEQWIRDEMRGRGVYASKFHTARRFESKMNAQDWLQKALSLVLAGGIMVGSWGATLPTVDNSFSGGGDRSQVVQVYEGQDVTSQYSREIDAMRNIARDVSGANPNAPITIYLVNELPAECKEVGHNGCAFRDGRIYIVSQGTYFGEIRTVLHEIAHALTAGDSHGDAWSEVFGRSAAELEPNLMGVPTGWDDHSGHNH